MNQFNFIDALTENLLDESKNWKMEVYLQAINNSLTDKILRSVRQNVRQRLSDVFFYLPLKRIKENPNVIQIKSYASAYN